MRMFNKKTHISIKKKQRKGYFAVFSYSLKKA